MKTRKILTLLAAGLFITQGIYAQCRDEHTYCDPSKDKNWQLSPQSKSGPFGLGETHELSVVIYDGMDYRISLCSNEPELEGKLEFEIYTMSTVKKYDSKKKRMRYMKEKQSMFSNRENEMVQELELSANGTKKLYISVYVPEGASEGGKRNKIKAGDIVCVGVLVQQQKGVDTGFK